MEFAKYRKQIVFDIDYYVTWLIMWFSLFETGRKLTRFKVNWSNTHTLLKNAVGTFLQRYLYIISYVWLLSSSNFEYKVDRPLLILVKNDFIRVTLSNVILLLACIILHYLKKKMRGGSPPTIRLLVIESMFQSFAHVWSNKRRRKWC